MDVNEDIRYNGGLKEVELTFIYTMWVQLETVIPVVFCMVQAVHKFDYRLPVH
jgi:hypothetical protein